MKTVTLNSIRNHVVSSGRHLGNKSALGLYELIVLPIGCFINMAAYGSLQPAALALCFVLFGLFLLKTNGSQGFCVRRIFLRTFATGWLMAGVAAVYANYFNDPGQLYLDAGRFFDITSTGGAEGLSLLEIQAIYENALPILMWSEVYKMFSELGFDRGRYIGVLININFVAFTSVLAMRISQRIYGIDERRFKLMVLFFSSCGILWLFSAIHIRDAVILFFTTLLLRFWIDYLTSPSLGFRLAILIAITIIGTVIFGFLRREFSFVPGAFAVAGIAALLFAKQKSSKQRYAAYIFVVCGLIAISVVLFEYREILYLALTDGAVTYDSLTEQESGSNSLGVALIYNQPELVRIILGSIYLYVFPVPFWSGIQLESVYHLFKSFNALFFYALIPLLLVSVRSIWSQGILSNSLMLFILFLVGGSTIAVAATSLENRHLGAFIVPIFILSLAADTKDPGVIDNYKHIFQLMLIGVLVVHAVLLAYKAI